MAVPLVRCGRGGQVGAQNKSAICEAICPRSTPFIVESETLEGVDAQYTMLDEIGEDVRLQFVRQLYDESLQRHGEHHKETRLLWEYISSFSRPTNVHCGWAVREMARAEQ
jgi:hypothetical protein